MKIDVMTDDEVIQSKRWKSYYEEKLPKATLPKLKIPNKIRVAAGGAQTRLQHYEVPNSDISET